MHSIENKILKSQPFIKEINMTFELYLALRSIGVDEVKSKKVAESLDDAIDQRVLFNLKQKHFENTLKKAEIKGSV
jgi:hypothetical protein